jgi:hypothetical protein
LKPISWVLARNLHWKESSADLFAVAKLECSVHMVPFAGKHNEGIPSTGIGPQTETETTARRWNRDEAAWHNRGDNDRPAA